MYQAWDTRKASSIFIGNPEDGAVRGCNVKAVISERGLVEVYWINLTQDLDKWHCSYYPGKEISDSVSR